MLCPYKLTQEVSVVVVSLSSQPAGAVSHVTWKHIFIKTLPA